MNSVSFQHHPSGRHLTCSLLFGLILAQLGSSHIVFQSLCVLVIPSLKGKVFQIEVLIVMMMKILLRELMIVAMLSKLYYLYEGLLSYTVKKTPKFF